MTDKHSKVEIERERAVPGKPQAEGWGALTPLRKEIDRLIDEFGAGFWHAPLGQRRPQMFSLGGDWAMSPAMEIADCEGEYRVTAEVPGMGSGDLEIKLANNTLTIRGEKSEERKDEKSDYLLSERRYGSFRRSMPLPIGVDAEKISASFANGVLTVTLPKTAEMRETERKIDIKSS